MTSHTKYTRVHKSPFLHLPPPPRSVFPISLHAHAHTLPPVPSSISLSSSSLSSLHPFQCCLPTPLSHHSWLGVGCKPLCHNGDHLTCGQEAYETCWWTQGTGTAHIVVPGVDEFPLLVQEERGAYFGHLFALLALIQSGRLVDPVCHHVVPL